MAWVFQDSRQRKKLGDAAPWCAGWIDPDGKRKSKKLGSRTKAERYARTVEGQIASGTYKPLSKKKWADFRKEFEDKVMSATSPGNQLSSKIALDHFEEIVKPCYVRSITTAVIDEFISKRRKQPGEKGGSTVSPCTVNKELRHIRAALRKAAKYKYLPEVPDIQMLREPEKLPTYVTPEHFALIYKSAVESATRPVVDECKPGDWWQALLVFLYLTGWRIREATSLRWDDVSLDNGTAITRHGDNKGKRDELVPLHEVVIQHLRKLVAASFNSPLVFPWPGNDRRLWDEFHLIQKEAGIELPCNENHEHTEGCHRYSFHDLRRGFATCNAEMMTADALQKLMRHKDYSTTKRYVNMASQLTKAVENLNVPEFLRKTGN